MPAARRRHVKPTSSWKEAIADRIRRVRSDLGVTAKALPSPVASLESARFTPTLQHVIATAGWANRHPLWVMYGRNADAPWDPRFESPAFLVAVRRELRRARLDKGLSTTDIAHRARASQSSVCRWESGEYERVNLAQWDLALRALGLTWDELLQRALEDVDEHTDSGGAAGA